MISMMQSTPTGDGDSEISPDRPSSTPASPQFDRDDYQHYAPDREEPAAPGYVNPEYRNLQRSFGRGNY